MPPSEIAAAQIRASTVDEMQSLAETLFREHYDEIATNKRVMRLSPDWLRYKALEAHDSLLILGAWQDSLLVGYSVSAILTHLHYSEMLYAQNDVLFVAKEHRRGRLGMRLMRETERIAASRGCRLVHWHAKQGTALEAILLKQGYRVQDIIFSREL